MSTIASGEFWAFVGVVAGIYTIFALGLQLEFGFTGLLNFGHVAFMAIGAYAMAILVVKSGFSTWSAVFDVNPVYKPVVAFGVLIAALLVRPQGLFGRARVAG